MATRRPASRSTNRNAAPVVPQPRSRSVLAQPTDSVEIRHHKSNSETETNIQVVIRCRGRSQREVNDGSPSIVNLLEAKSSELTIETASPTTTLGVVTLPPIRKYPFDLVYGAQADQAMIFADVVHPMLEKVILGYNCTLFAYGQTGTGKTYTMQGELTPSPLGKPNMRAGMIPRVLHHLFNTLDSTVSDYSVKISYIELYNEELRDLLASEVAPPTGSTQPMGKATKPAESLKIFDDASKRGVFVQGVEEIAVKDSAGALRLLLKGSERRQIAATKFNDHSSRSHSIFSITVHTKETGVAGEDLLKMGKLNLVDLAGSENIGRSGAENKRAREAGMINQSLLTLGRVINALVEKSPHVPYRESKLTRLLQDALGGRTNTCILATISPARSNLEETLSTLDYALNAKSIRNKPELNQRMTRNSLLKEYIAEIERLKGDLMAAREKTGIFISEEAYNQQLVDKELRQTELEEATRQIEIVENQMAVIREEFEQSMQLLLKREKALEETQEKLYETEKTLAEREGRLQHVEGALQDEVVVRQALEATEIGLNIVATDLKNVAKEGVNDVGALFEKLERKAKILAGNSNAVVLSGKNLSATTKALAHDMDEFIKLSSQHTQQLQADANTLGSEELSNLASYSQCLEQQLKSIQSTLEAVYTQDVPESEALSIIHTSLKQTREFFQTSYRTWTTDLCKTSNDLVLQLRDTTNPALRDAANGVKAMASITEAILSEAYDFVERQKQNYDACHIAVSSAAAAEIKRLKQQNETLARMLETERTKSNAAKDVLVQRVSSLLSDFVTERDHSLREAVGSVQAGLRTSDVDMRAFSKRHDELMTASNADATTVSAAFDKRTKDAKRYRDGTFKTLNTTQEALDSVLGTLNSDLTSSLTSFTSNVESQMDGMQANCSNGFEEHSRAKRARFAKIERMTADSHTALQKLHGGIASTSQNIDTMVSGVVTGSDRLSSALKQWHQSAGTQLSSMKQMTTLLMKQGTVEDAPTGSTPRKKAWNYVDQWELTKGRDELLRLHREEIATNYDADVQLDEEEEDTPTESVPAMEQWSPTAPSTSATPLLSSTSSTSSAVPHPQLRPPKPKVFGHVPGTGPPLMDTKNVYASRGSRRRAAP